MKVQTRLNLLCSLIFGIIFTIVAILIFVLYYDSTQSFIYENLKKITHISALFYLEEDEVNESEFEKIRTQFNEIVSDACMQVYNADNQLSYGMKNRLVSSDILNKVRTEKQLTFNTENELCYGIFYEDNQGDFVILAKEKKEVLSNQIYPLLWILCSCLLLGLLAIVLLGRWVSAIAYRPFSKIIKQVQDISTHNLNVQIESPNTKDELQELTNTFNELLSKIAETVIIQRNFVNYVSHEFKTPLASLLGNLEVFSLKERTPEEYRQLSENLIEQVNQLEEILNILMVISDLQQGKQNVEQTRLDEVVWEIIEKVNQSYPHNDIQVKLTIEEEPLLFVSIERTQLLMLLYNLVENAVKYSQGKTVEIVIFNQDNQLYMNIIDKGIGIMPEHLAHISKPFYRADHTNQIEGSGIGLSIALRIMEKNSIKYELTSEAQSGTMVTLKF